MSELSKLQFYCAWLKLLFKIVRSSEGILYFFSFVIISNIFLTFSSVQSQNFFSSRVIQHNNP